MSNYRLGSTGVDFIDVPSSSSIDEPHVRARRRGTIYRTLGGRTVVQYSDIPAVGDTQIVWTIPLASAQQYGVLYSASIGTYGDSLTFTSPVWGSFLVAFVPGEEGLKVTKMHPHTFGYTIEIKFVRLS